MILYPTETVYALGVNAFSASALEQLTAVKQRRSDKYNSVLVRDISDIERWGMLSDAARRMAEEFLPGPLTLVLPVRSGSGAITTAPDGTLGFRISPDLVAQATIAEFMSQHDTPLTCTSANVSGLTPQPTTAEILNQFGEHASLITRVVDDGIRSGTPSTVVSVTGDTVTVHREGSIPASSILAQTK